MEFFINKSVGGEICFGALSFFTDDSAWLREAPLDVEVSPIRCATHFRIFVWSPSPAALGSVPSGRAPYHRVPP